MKLLLLLDSTKWTMSHAVSVTRNARSPATALAQTSATSVKTCWMKSTAWMSVRNRSTTIAEFAPVATRPASAAKAHRTLSAKTDVFPATEQLSTLTITSSVVWHETTPVQVGVKKGSLTWVNCNLISLFSPQMVSTNGTRNREKDR